MTLGLRQLALATMLVSGLMVGTAHADGHQLDGQFLSATYYDGELPAGFAQVSVRESTPVWDCTSGTCSLTSPLTAAVVFAPTSGQAVAVTSQALDFFVLTETKSQVLVDPHGQQWALTADLNKWLIGVDIASQGPQGSDAQFATAYGRFKYSGMGAFVPSWPGDVPTVFDPWWGWDIGESTVLGLKTSGAVGLGPGHNGVETGVEQGSIWDYRTQLDGANYAYPSTTDVHCASLSCMEFKTGIVNVNNYFLSFDVKATALPVPETGTLPMMALGLAGMALLARRRRQG